MVPNKIKLVIWDLDETFWTGTLSEGTVEIPPRNAGILRTLARRGIVSSICSKNDFAAVQARLAAEDLWDYFVFPRIEFAPKGAAIAALIEQMNLRPDNVLFIDDNRLNLEEARHFSPALMAAHPDEILEELLALPQAQGKDDSELSRLRQYRLLEEKFRDQARAAGSNEEFLRGCGIVVEIDTDVESHIDRVVELINRSNQLNFTKKRVETEAEEERFAELLREYGYHSGVVKVRDRYGDYGVVGFFMVSHFAWRHEIEHFVFSCRIMNMGIEQYVYERLGKPAISVVGPVSGGLADFTAIDWINRGSGAESVGGVTGNEKLMLVGGCDLLQVSTYLSTDRSEFVNRMNREVMVRYDDPGFILSDRAAVDESDILPMIPCWTKEDVRRFDRDLSEASTLLLSFAEAVDGDYMLLGGDILLRVDSRFLGRSLGRAEDGPYLGHVKFLRLALEEKLGLALRAFDRIARVATAAHVFLLGAPTRRRTGGSREARLMYNLVAEDYCLDHAGFEYVSLDEVIPESEIIDEQHFTRRGYFALSEHLQRRIAVKSGEVRVPDPARGLEGFQDIVSGGVRLECEGGRLVTARLAV